MLVNLFEYYSLNKLILNSSEFLSLLVRIRAFEYTVYIVFEYIYISAVWNALNDLCVRSGLSISFKILFEYSYHSISLKQYLNILRIENF